MKPRGILEDEGPIVAHFLDETQSLLEVSLYLAWKSNDNVGGESKRWRLRPKELDLLQVVVTTIAALHSTKRPVGARLNRKMDVFAEAREAGHCLRELFCDVTGIRAGKSDPHLSFDDAIDRLEQLDEAGGRSKLLPVGVDCLAQQGDLTVPPLFQLADLLNDLLERPAALSPSCEWDDAERAKAITPLHNADPCLDGASAVDRRRDRIGEGWCPGRRKPATGPISKQPW